MQKVLEQQKRVLEQLTKAAPAAAEAKDASTSAKFVVSPVSAPTSSPATAGTEPTSLPHAATMGQVASTTPIIPAAQKSQNAISSAAAVAAISGPPHPETEPASPLQFKIGSTSITPLGFMDFTGVYRTKDNGSGIGTNFGSIPYALTGNSGYATNLSEFRLSMQNSRVGFRTDTDVHGAHIIGYMEMDFLGNNPGNVAVSSNSNTVRSRLYWVDVRRGAWEVLAGQTWSLLTPGRSGISPIPGDIFYTQDMDVNYQAGLFWGRIPELRVVYHYNKSVAFAVAVDSPEQYAGGSSGGSLVTFPSALSTSYSSQLNVGSNTLGVPNVAPDIVAKLALDHAKKAHFEVGGVERNFKVWSPVTGNTYTAAGGAGFANLHFEVFKGFRLLTNNYWSDGGGRYLFGQAPDLIAHTDGTISPVHSASTVTGFELTQKNTLVYGYYGGIYVGRNFTVTATDPLTGLPTAYAGYGFPLAVGSTTTPQNRAIQEATVGIVQTFWKNPKFGALSLITQYSYLARNPWSIVPVASGPANPTNASLNMVFVDLRYTLPGSAPTLGK